MNQRVKQNFLQDPIVLAAPLATNLEERPTTVTILSADTFKLDNVQKGALALLIIPVTFGFVLSIINGDWTLAGITGFLLLLVGFMVWIIRLRSDMSWQVTWNDDSVDVIDGRYGRPVSWHASLNEFDGLKLDHGFISRGGRYSANRRVHGLLLAHPDPDKSILLHASGREIKPETVTYYAEQLQMSEISIG